MMLMLMLMPPKCYFFSSCLLWIIKTEIQLPSSSLCRVLQKFFMGTPQPLLSFIFGHFKQISSQFLQQICEKCPSSIWCRDSKPLPLEHESPPMTTRPGLPDVLHKLDNDIFYFTLMMFTTECIIIVWCKNTNYGQNFYCAPTMVISFAS